MIRRRVAIAACALVLVTASSALAIPTEISAAPIHHIGSPTGAAQRTWVDRRVDGISDDALLHADPTTLVDPIRASIAQHVAQVRRPLFFIWAFTQVLALFLLWRCGAAARLRITLLRFSRNRFVLRALFACALVAVVAFVTLPFDLFNLHLAQTLGLTREALPAWLHDWSIGVGLEMLTVAAVVVIGLELVDRTRYRYLWASGLVLAFGLSMLIINPVVIAPLFHRYVPISRTTPLGLRLTQIEERAGVGLVPIFETDLSRTTEVGNAFVAGIGPTKRVVIGDTLLRTATPREIAFVMAHELGHDHHGDAFRITLLTTLLVILVVASAVVCAERVPIRADDDPLSRLALIGALGYVFALLLFPAGNAYSRRVEAGADAFGLRISNDPAAAARMFIRFADEGFSPLCPPSPVKLYFYDHPPLASRIDAVTGRPDSCR